MGFASLLFYLYVLIISAALIGLGSWLHKQLSRKGYAPERRTLMLLIIMPCLTVIAFFIGAKINNWTNSTTDDDQPPPPQIPATPIQQEAKNPQQTGSAEKNTKQVAPPATLTDTLANESIIPEAKPLTTEEQLALFEMENYPALYEQRVALNQDIEQQEIFFQTINQLAVRVPKQRDLLVQIYRIRQQLTQKLKQKNIDASQHLRDFWVHYNTGNSHDAITKFNKVVPDLTRSIQSTRSQKLDYGKREANVMGNSMQSAGQALKNNRLPPQLAGKITAYSPANRKLLTDWLSTQDSNLILPALDRLSSERNLIRDRINQVKSFQQRYIDLYNILDRTLKLWTKALEANYYAEYRLLNAIEHRYIVDELGLDTASSADERLARDLIAYTESVAGYAEDMLEKAEQAYQPPQLR